MKKNEIKQYSILGLYGFVSTFGAAAALPHDFVGTLSDTTTNLVKQNCPKVTSDLFTEGMLKLLVETATPYMVAIDILNVDNR